MTQPLVANGRVFVPTFDGKVFVFGFPPSDDFDHDGIIDTADNCPFDYNPDQADTNFEAERALACGLPCNDPAKDGTPPSGLIVSQTAVNFFHANYRGDACDPVPTTLLQTEVRALNHATPQPCRICTTNPPGCTPSPDLCFPATNTGMTFDSWTVAGGGGHGLSSPAACDCPTSIAMTDDPRHEAVRKCHQFSSCTIGDDGLFPLNSLNSPWRATSLDVAYQVSMVHQKPYVPGFVPMTQSFVWNYPVDQGLFTDVPGQGVQTSLWGHVNSFTLSGHIGCPGCGGPDPRLKHNYLFLAPRAFTRIIVNRGLLPPTPPLPTEWNSFAWAEANVPSHPPTWISFAFIDGSTFPFTQVGDNVQAAASSFAQDALNLLAPVGRRQAELLVGDDVAWGVPFQRNPIAAVVVQPGTTTLLGALQTIGGSLASVHKCIATSGLCDPPGPPPDLRSYVALDGQLFTLHADTPGATLNKIDVRSALANAPVASTVDLVGAVPVRPVAMAWHFAERSFYVLDDVRVGTRHALRLLKVSEAGQSVELWRTLAAQHVPRAFVSVGIMSEILIALGDDENAEIAAIDASGAPLLSKSFEDAFLVKAPIGNMGGISVPFAHLARQEATNLRLDFVRRSEATPGICDAPWLRHHASKTSGDPLSKAALACRARDDDDDDDGRGGHHGDQ
jgi:hypothetical protein